MKRVRLLDLGIVSPLRSQTVYHAVAHAMTEDSPDTIILVSPARPYICIGFHQDLTKEVDLDYCEQLGLPLYRREVGGGAVYLDSGQVFVQWIFHPGRLPAELNARFELYIRPLVETYRSLGIYAYHRPINDIHVDGKKIGGTGAALMGNAEVTVGSLMFTFDKKTMARVLRVSSEKMRDKIYESLEQYMTTIGESLPVLPGRDDVIALYLQHCTECLGAEIRPGVWEETEERAALEWDERFLTEEWLYQKGGLKKTGVKIHEAVQVADSAFKAPGGLIRVTVRLRDRAIDDIAISGDFTILPASSLAALEEALRGVNGTRDDVLGALRDLYRRLDVQSPGVSPEDFATAILGSIEPAPGEVR